MKKETRTVVYDEELRLEAYRFEGTRQPFPNHFHEYYVIGFVEEGTRELSSRNREYTIKKGSIILFNPGDNHACVQSDDGTFNYRGFNISKETMLELVEEVTGKRELPGFSKNVIYDEEAACYLRLLHEMVMKGTGDFGKEETLLFLISLLIQNYGQPFESCIPECRKEIEKACELWNSTFQREFIWSRYAAMWGLASPHCFEPLRSQRVSRHTVTLRQFVLMKQKSCCQRECRLWKPL